MSIPRIAFFGICDRTIVERNYFYNLPRLSIVGLRCQIVSHIFPLPTRSLTMVLGLHDPTTLKGAKLVLQPEGSPDHMTLEIATTATSSPPGPGFTADHVLLPKTTPWILVALTISGEQVLMIPPGIVNVSLAEDDGSMTHLGSLDFIYAPAPPLSVDRIAAIKSNPWASKAARMQLSCNSCKASFRVYTGLDRSAKLEEEGYLWYAGIPDVFRCLCGKLEVDLSKIRESFHGILGRITRKDEEKISLTHLYERASLGVVYDQFAAMLAANTTEGTIHEFLNDNTILFHPFSPSRLINKAPILNRYQTDFAILTSTGDLLLVEIEKPSTRILGKSGHGTAHLNHALDQVRDWLQIVKEHRKACLDMMSIADTEVAKVRGLVIAGRGRIYEPDEMRRLKSTDYGEIDVWTFDDLLNSLGVLIREMSTSLLG